MVALMVVVDDLASQNQNKFRGGLWRVIEMELSSEMRVEWLLCVELCWFLALS